MQNNAEQKCFSKKVLKYCLTGGVIKVEWSHNRRDDRIEDTRNMDKVECVNKTISST